MRKSSRANRLKYTQNRIDYIVYGNPKEVAKLLYDKGYEPPKNPHDLVKATKQLVKKEGVEIVKKLIKLHPDKKAILQTQAVKQDHFCNACSNHSYQPESNLCGSCGHSSYTGDRQEFLNQLEGMVFKELEEYYKNILKKSNANSEDKELSEEVEMVWNELRLRKAENKKEIKEESKESEGALISVKDGRNFVLGSLIFAAGIMVGASHTIKSFVNE